MKNWPDYLSGQKPATIVLVSLKDVKKGTILSNCLDQTTAEKYRHSVNSPLRKGEYHLGLYKIIVNSDEGIFWEKYDGLNKINKGSCVIISGLLFIQSGLYDTPLNRCDSSLKHLTSFFRAII